MNKWQFSILSEPSAWDLLAFIVIAVALIMSLPDIEVNKDGDEEF